MAIQAIYKTYRYKYTNTKMLLNIETRSPVASNGFPSGGQ
ncbi:hypothetical protein O59_003939 [Cellvibrio sp. BR]|nr:hypothetical protein O59_003939 [Cellvibrio sp. BR]